VKRQDEFGCLYPLLFKGTGFDLFSFWPGAPSLRVLRGWACWQHEIPPSISYYRWAAETPRTPAEKILVSAFAVHAPASVLPIASMIPMLATEPDFATRTSANSDPEAKPAARLNAFTLIQLLQLAAWRRSTSHCASARHAPAIIPIVPKLAARAATPNRRRRIPVLFQACGLCESVPFTSFLFV